MLQFNKSDAINTNAVWIPTVNTSSGYYSNLIAVYSQSYDESNGTFSLSTVSAPNQFRNWLVISNSGSVVPTPTGQYNVEIYTATGGVNPTWATATDVWSTSTQSWNNYGAGNLPDTLIYSDRAYISGSNEQGIVQYVSPNENGTYTTYNG